MAAGREAFLGRPLFLLTSALPVGSPLPYSGEGQGVRAFVMHITGLVIQADGDLWGGMLSRRAAAGGHVEKPKRMPTPGYAG